MAIVAGVLVLLSIGYFVFGRGPAPEPKSAMAPPAPVEAIPEPVRDEVRKAPELKVNAPIQPAALVEQPVAAPAPIPIAPVVTARPAPAVVPPKDEPKPALIVVANKESVAVPLSVDLSKLNAYLERFDAEALKGRYPEARRIAKEADVDAALAPVAKEVHALDDLALALSAGDDASAKTLQALVDGKAHALETKRGQEIGIVEKVTQDQIWIRIDLGGGNVAQKPIKLVDLSDAQRKRLAGDYKPSTSSEHLALAINALANQDLEQAKSETTAAAGDSLASHYQEKIHALELVLLEDKAGKAWKALHIGAVPPPTAQATQEEINKLDDFEKAFGQTKFAASVADKIRDARALAQKALGCIGALFVNKPQNNEFIEVKADGAQSAERYTVDQRNPDLVAAIAKVVSYRRIQMQWKENAGQKQVVALEMLPPPDKPTGVMAGKVSDKSLQGFPYLEIQNESGEYSRFAPGKHGSDPQFPGLIAKVKVGDPVKVEWEFEMRLRLVKVE